MNIEYEYADEKRKIIFAAGWDETLHVYDLIDVVSPQCVGDIHDNV